MDNSERIKRMESLLKSALMPSELIVIDESYKHIGHEGAKGGAGHFKIDITSGLFKGKTLIARHQMVYAALADMMQTDIHALSMTCKAL